MLEIDKDFLVTAILFQELIYVKESADPLSVVVGFDPGCILQSLPIAFYDESAHQAFTRTVQSYSKASIAIITKQDIEVLPRSP